MKANGNAVLSNTTISLRISILQGSTIGVPVYIETDHPTTDSNGQINIVIGGSAGLPYIDWSNGSYFLKTEVDIKGGTNYQVLSTTQLLSVPYALYADKAGSSINESDPIFSSHAAHGITSGNISNWNTAYSWGNHSGLYRPVDYVPLWSEIKNKPTTIDGFGITDAVNTTGDQTIAGNKTFTGNTTVPNALHAGNGFASIYNETEKIPLLGAKGNVSIGTDSKWDWSELDVNGGINVLPGQWDWGSGIALSAWDAQGGGGEQYLIGSTGALAHEGAGKFFIRNTNHYWDAIFIMDNQGRVGIHLGLDGLPQHTLDVGGDINFTGNLLKNGSPYSYVPSWNEITNKPTFAAVATSGIYNDLTNKPTIDGSETKVTSGTNVTVTGEGTIASPYVINSTGGGSGSSHIIGESYGGGIVFYVYDNGQHGLIAATVDQSIGIRWYAGTYTNTMAFGDGVGAGKANTAIIIANQGNGDGATYAARICNEYSVTVDGVTYGDWYLPSKYELNLLYLQQSVVGGFGKFSYASSTELFTYSAWLQTFHNGIQYTTSKSDTYCVRAVRAF